MKILLVGDPHIGFLSSSFLRGFSPKIRLSLVLKRLEIYDYILKRPEKDVVIMGDLLHQGLETDFSIFEVAEILKIKEIQETKNLVLIEGHHDRRESYSDLKLFPFFDDFLVLENPKRIFFNARRDFNKAREILKKLQTDEEVFLFFHEEFDIWYDLRGLKPSSDILTIKEIKECFPNSVIIGGHFHIPFQTEDFWAVGSLTPISFSEQLQENESFKWSGITFLDTESKKLERIYYFPFLFVKFKDFSDLDSLIEKVSNYPSPIFAEFVDPPIKDKKFNILKIQVTGYRIKERERVKEESLEIDQPEITKEDIIQLVKEKLGDLLTDQELEEIFKNL